MFPFANVAQVRYWHSTGTRDALTLPAVLPLAAGRGGSGSLCCLGVLPVLLLLLIASSACQGSYDSDSSSSTLAIDPGRGRAITKKNSGGGGSGSQPPASAAAAAVAMTGAAAGSPSDGGGSRYDDGSRALAVSRAVAPSTATASGKVALSAISSSSGSRRSSGAATAAPSFMSRGPGRGSAAAFAAASPAKHPDLKAQFLTTARASAAAPSSTQAVPLVASTVKNGPAVASVQVAEPGGSSSSSSPLHSRLALPAHADEDEGSPANERGAASMAEAAASDAAAVTTRWAMDLRAYGDDSGIAVTTFAAAVSNGTYQVLQQAPGPAELAGLSRASDVTLQPSAASSAASSSSSSSSSFAEPGDGVFDEVCPGFTRTMLVPIDCSNLTQCELDAAQTIDSVKLKQVRGGFGRIIQQYDCRAEFQYSEAASCKQCEIAYTLWLCSTELRVYWNGSNVIQPCADVCDAVVKDCPYILPQPASVEPCFLCRDKHIEDTQAYSSSCYSFDRTPARSAGQSNVDGSPRMVVRPAAASATGGGGGRATNASQQLVPLQQLLLLLLLLVSLSCSSGSFGGWCGPWYLGCLSLAELPGYSVPRHCMLT